MEPESVDWYWGCTGRFSPVAQAFADPSDLYVALVFGVTIALRAHVSKTGEERSSHGC